MIEVMNWIAQDAFHFFGTLLFLTVCAWLIGDIIRAGRAS